MAERTKVIVVDDHPLMRMGIRSILETSKDDIEVIGEASSGKQLLEMLNDKKPDLVLLDIIMPDMGGVETSRILKNQFADIKILILSSDTQEETIYDLVTIGIDGFISKSSASSEILLAVHDLAEGLPYFGADVAPLIRDVRISKKIEDQHFTERELEVIKLCCDGMLSKEIAKYLGISARTVEGHKLNIFKKLGLNTTIEMVKYVIKNKIINL